jgi:EAL domain-containing protein (putative c-di-GMP-specific phosphodiesterase class I)
MPVDELKIDKSFVTDMAFDENAALIVRSTIDLGRNLGLRVVAEGVETREVWDQLAALGCHVAQGYFFGRAVAAPQFLRHVAAREVKDSLTDENEARTSLRPLRSIPGSIAEQSKRRREARASLAVPRRAKGGAA